MITCTFAGHREVFGSCTQKIENALETLIENEDTLYCYVGGMGEFDGFSAAAVRNLKRKYPNKKNPAYACAAIYAAKTKRV